MYLINAWVLTFSNDGTFPEHISKRLRTHYIMNEKIIKLMGRKNYVPANLPELLRLLRRPAGHQRQLQSELKELEKAGRIARIKGKRYILPEPADLIPGRIQMKRRGNGYLMPEDPELDEIAITAEDTGTAMHDDRVLVRRDAKTPRNGKVVRVLERRRTQIVGTLKRGRRFLHVIPDDPRHTHDIYVKEPRDVGQKARDGDKVVVEFKSWESRHESPEGEVVEVLGPPTAEGVDMLAVLRQYELPRKFPRKVLQDVRKFGKTVSDRDLEGRQDCRRHPVITIDPDTAKDFDDAFYLERAPNNRWKLWVHIADVTHYVKPDSALDREARKRGNSTYLVDRVIPMLPEALSNELCSLKPGVDRLTKCVEFLIDDNGAVVRYKMYSAVIHSKRRFTYREALAVLEGKPSGRIEKMLSSAHRLAQRIRRRRFKDGSLDLDFTDSKIHLDNKGRVERIEQIENDMSHQLIEEFMLLANEAAADRLMKSKRPGIYRIHEPPNPERLDEYRQEVMSYGIPCGNLTKPGAVKNLFHRLNRLPLGPALKIGFLKAMMRARYSVKPLGHYGLAKAKYTHFTSPIRRYADLLVHRSLFEKSPGALSGFQHSANHISGTERNSADAERDSRNVKLFVYLEAQLTSKEPKSYPAMITDLRNFGFFVDVTALGMSGLVPLSELEGDFYTYDRDRNEIRSRRRKRTFRLGDMVEVEVAKVDTRKKQVDFRLAASRPRKKKKSARKKKK
ncbi:MAG: ribonuclease R [Verrucomicrobiota bacterium]